MMDYNQIMEEISGNLSGNWQKDVNFLKNETENYKKHPIAMRFFVVLVGLSFKRFDKEK